ncbi:type II membrane protein [Coemansia sp. RSA 2702]|nr:type II membrane protein [Coemansia sp. RSA 2702]
MRSWVSSFIEYVADQLKHAIAAELSPLSVRRLVAFKGHRSAPCDADSSERIDMALAQDCQSLGSVENVEAPEYANAVALIEVRQCPSEQNRAYWQLAQRTQTLHSTQLNRRFAWGLTVCGTHVRACLFGNDDILASEVMDVATESGRKQLVTLLVNWAMCESQRLGYDSTIRYNGETGQWEIDVWDNESRVTHAYIHERTLFDTSSQFGRRTRCFIASAKENSGKQPVQKVLIKDAWAPTEFPGSEVVRDELSNLRTIRDKLGADDTLAGTYSHLEAGGVVQQMHTKQRTADDTTVSIFADIDASVLEDVPARIHRRVATTPVGEQLKSVRSVDELIVVVGDVMAAHTAIVRRCGILHRDLSTNNIMFCHDDDGMVRGLLIDFDNAVLQSDLHDEQRLDQIGTFPYMSIGNLEQSSVKRTALDDWESLIYILCWLGTIGINRDDQTNVKIRSDLTICHWHDAFDCKKAQVAGYTYDLSPLANEITLESNVTTPPTITGTKYRLNPCAPLAADPDSVPAIDRCPANSWVCRLVTNFKKDEKPRVTEVNAVAGVGTKDEPRLEARASGNESPREFHWKMSGAEVEKVGWSADIKFICDKSAKNEDQPKIVGFSEGVLSLEWAVPAACALGDDGKDKTPDDKDGDQDDKSGGGFFSTLFTLFIVGASLYLVVGVMYKSLVVRASGLDLIPNLAFWREFPYLCADFAQHIWDMVSGRRRDGYSVV